MLSADQHADIFACVLSLFGKKYNNKLVLLLPLEKVQNKYHAVNLPLVGACVGGKVNDPVSKKKNVLESNSQHAIAKSILGEIQKQKHLVYPW